MIDWLAYLKFAYELLKNVFSLVRRFTSKGVILDFIEPFKLDELEEGGGFSSDCVPKYLGFSICLVAENKDETNPHLLQKITAELVGLKDIGWTSGPGTAYVNNNVLQLPRSLEPREKLPIRLTIRIGFNRVAERFVEELCRLKNKQQKIRVEYTVRERDKTKTKTLEKTGINFFEYYYSKYMPYLQSCSDDEKAKQLLKLLQAK